MVRSISALRLAPLLGDAARRRPAYRGIADTLRLLIDDGRVPAGTRLPSERDLAGALGISRTTVTRSYQELVEIGFATARQGSGTLAALPDRPGRSRSAALVPYDAFEDPGPSDLPAPIDLTCAVLPPPRAMADAYRRALSRWPHRLNSPGYHPMGLPELRRAVAERFTARGLPTTTDQVMITSGAVSAHAIVARALLGPGDRLLVESPTYPNGLESLRAHGVRPVPVPLDTDGWDIDAWRAALTQVTPRAVLTLPDFHNPTGLYMRDEDRRALSDALRRTRTLAIVDETLVASAIDDHVPAPPFASYGAEVITIGGSSKSHWSGLRIGWLRAPQQLMAQLAAARTALDLGSPVLEQLALLELMADEEAIAAERSATARERRDALVDALRTTVPKWHFDVPRGGLCLWITLPEARATALSVAAEAHGVLVAPGPRFAPEPGLERYLRLPFAASPDDLRTAVSRLADAWLDLDARPSSRSLPRTLIA